MTYHPDFREACNESIQKLFQYGEVVDSGRWQGHPTAGQPSLVTKELLNLTLEVPCDRHLPTESWTNGPLNQLAEEIQPNLPWADEHFVERIGGKPMNPDPSYERWPWWRGQESSKQAGEQFTHTYSERFWPRYAGEGDDGPYRTYEGRDNRGIRYPYGDYGDLIDLLYKEPMTRQATLPIFFPEDTGAVHGGRIPCTLHYHFLRRNDKLHLWYPIRSCDAVRHFRDDVYLAVRLMLHTIELLQLRERVSFEGHIDDLPDHLNLWRDVRPGTLYFTAYSFHVHMGDIHVLKAK